MKNKYRASIKYKASIGLFLIFTINMVFLLSYYEFSLKNGMVETIKTMLQNRITDKIQTTISSEEEADRLIEEIEKGVYNNSVRDSISKQVIVRILYFEAYVFFIVLLFCSIFLYFGYVRPLEDLAAGMDNFSRGIVPKKRRIRRDEIGKLQNQFVKLTQSLEAERQKQNRIIASISHDIKTPLTAVMGYAERILKKDFPREKEIKYLQTIYSKAQTINEIINEFDEYLSYNLESSLSLKEYDISYVCNLIREEYTDELLDIGVKFDVLNNCNDSRFQLDLIKFKRVIGNLVSNSVKHMSSDPAISLTADTLEKGVLFTFIDNGCGIPESELPYIFEPLYTSDKSRKVAGLGLSICKNIVNAHSGTITASNAIPSGLKIEIWLPYIYIILP